MSSRSEGPCCQLDLQQPLQHSRQTLISAIYTPRKSKHVYRVEFAANLYFLLKIVQLMSI